MILLVPRQNAKKEKKRKAWAAFIKFNRRLTSACNTFEDIDEWYGYVNYLMNIIDKYSDVIPDNVRNTIEEHTTVVDNSRTAIRRACQILKKDIGGLTEDVLTDSGIRPSPAKIAAGIGSSISIAVVVLFSMSSGTSEFDLTTETSEISLLAMQSDSIPIRLNLVSGDKKKIDLSCQVAPKYLVGCSLGPNSAFIGNSVNLILHADDTASEGTFPVEISGIGKDGAQDTLFIDVTVMPKPSLKVLSSFEDNFEVNDMPLKLRTRITDADDLPVAGADVQFVLNDNPFENCTVRC